MKKTKLILALTAAVFMSTVVMAVPTSLPSERGYLEQALACESVSAGMTLDTPINGGIEITKPTKEKIIDETGKEVEKITGFKTVKDTGAGLMRVFETEEGDRFVVLGNRFGKSWKFSVGGKVDPEDATLRAAFSREVSEELFGQLAISDQLTLLKTDAGTDLITTAGGMKTVTKEDGTPGITTDGWGPYFTAFCVQTGLTQADLATAVSIMNMNASLHHTYLEKVFSGSFDDKTGALKTDVDADALKAQASATLAKFDQSKSNDGFVDMSASARDVLTALTESGSYRFESPSSYKAFLENVRLYAEYSEFKLLSWDDYVAQADADAKLSKEQQTYFANEKKARETFVTEFSKKKA